MKNKQIFYQGCNPANCFVSTAILTMGFQNFVIYTCLDFLSELPMTALIICFLFLTPFTFLLVYCFIFWITRALFVPPKPNELDKKTSIFLWIVLGAIFSLAEYSSGCSKFMFGATKEFCIIRIE